MKAYTLGELNEEVRRAKYIGATITSEQKLYLVGDVEAMKAGAVERVAEILSTVITDPDISEHTVAERIVRAVLDEDEGGKG